MSFTGVQMLTGTTIRQPSPFGDEPEVTKVEPEPFAIVAFTLILLAFAASFVKGNKNAILPAIPAGLAVLSLLLAKYRIDARAMKEGEGILYVSWAFGFWFVLLLLMAVVALNGYVYYNRDDEG